MGIPTSRGWLRTPRFRARRVAIVAERISATLSAVDLPVVRNRTGDLPRRSFAAAGASIARYLDTAPGFLALLRADESHGPVAEVGSPFALAGSMCAIVLATRRPFVLGHGDPTLASMLRAPYRQHAALHCRSA